MSLNQFLVSQDAKIAQQWGKYLNEMAGSLNNDLPRICSDTEEQMQRMLGMRFDVQSVTQEGPSEMHEREPN